MKKKNSKKNIKRNANKKITITAIISTIIIIITTFLLSFFIHKNSLKKEEQKTLIIKDSITYELGNKLPDNKDFFTNYTDEDIKEIKYYKDNQEVKTLNIGTYDVEIITDNKTYKTVIKVIDSTKPVLKLNDLSIFEDETYEIEQFVESCIDNSETECILEYQDEEMLNYSKEGVYTIKIIAKDNSNNKTVEETQLTITKKVETDDQKKNTSTETGKSTKTTTTTEVKTESKTTNNNSSNKSGTNSNVTESKTYNVTLLLDDGKNKIVLGVKENQTIPQNVETTKEGRNFKEWQLDGKTFNLNTKITKNITLVAIYNDVAEITHKYGVTISTINGRSTYDYSTFNATTSDLLGEAKSVSANNISTYNELVKYVNELRKSEGKTPLTLDTALSQAATLRAIEMAWANNFSHTRPNGTICFSVLNELGINSYSAAENIAAWQTSAKQAFDSWNNSQGHHDNMIGNFTKIGIGKYTLDGKTYWVQLFTR